MSSPYATTLRTHTCGELRASHDGQAVTLCGWVDRRRDHGGLIFIDLRDRFGRIQVVLNPEETEGLSDDSQHIRLEDVLSIEGAVRKRPDDKANKDLATGEVEIPASRLTILNRAADLPLSVSGPDESHVDHRMRYRALDLRRADIQSRFELRHRTVNAIRTFMDGEGFWDVETPILTRSTPEGARDYLVPSRVSPGTFYALPQSPQQFKQVFMCAGFDRYYQIARCFRDEDLRADRQPEFTQLDIEMAFVSEQDVQDVMERLMANVIHDVLGIDLVRPFPRVSYAQAMARYGSDKPDTRFGMELVNLSDVAARSSMNVFQSVVKSGGAVLGLVGPKCADLSRKDIDRLEAGCKDRGAKGLAWSRVENDGLVGGIARFFEGDLTRELIEAAGASVGDMLFLVAAETELAKVVLGDLRGRLAEERNLIPENSFDFLWVTEFPLFDKEKESGRLTSCHHPFTAPLPDDIDILSSDPLKARSLGYDLVLNGFELAGGSIRIHQSEIQQQIFELLNIGADEAHEKFQFLLEALSFGAPPHGGIAMGIDRLVAIIAGLDNIREVIAFPKTHRAACPATGAPSIVDGQQLSDLGIEIVKPEE